MAHIQIIIRRDNGVQMEASGEVGDLDVLDMSTMLGAMLFDAAATPFGLFSTDEE